MYLNVISDSYRKSNDNVSTKCNNYVDVVIEMRMIVILIKHSLNKMYLYF